MIESNSVRFCRLTPNGRGAIATIWVAGPDAAALLDHCFQPNSKHRTVAKSLVGDLLYGIWNSSTNASPSSSDCSDSAEDLVITIPQSEQFEIHCHGGQISYQIIARDLSRLGASEISTEDYLRRGAANFWVAELHGALLQAETELAAITIADQCQIWPPTLTRWLSLLNDDACPSLLSELQQLQDQAPTSRHLLQPWKVLLQGAPNVGKSSLINAMVGFERALVDPTPGTTRDVIGQRTVIAGWPVELFDTAGIREGAEPLESEAIQRGQAEALQADCLVRVFDLSVPQVAEAAENPRDRLPDIVVLNKIDLVATERLTAQSISVSAKMGINIDLLLKRIIDTLVPTPLPAHSPLLITVGMESQLQQVIKALERGDYAAAEIGLRGQ